MSAKPPDPQALVYNLLLSNLQITADDDVTPIVALQTDLEHPATGGRNLILAYDPYPQEGGGNQPQVIVGPRKPSARRALTLPPIWYEVDDMLRVRIITRDWTTSDYGFLMEGSEARNKVLDAIVGILVSNFRDPDGTGTWTWVRALDDGVSSDEPPGGPTSGATSLFRTDLTVACRRYSQGH